MRLKVTWQEVRTGIKEGMMFALNNQRQLCKAFALITSKSRGILFFLGK